LGLLDTYNRKRDFKKTPEPKGVVRASEGELTFCIQKHAATRLHYDFRLELDGVLKSWAVPKGPTLDTAEKRLAIQTEDHPLDYGDFEGTIAKGEYGGGTVELWDRGTWEPVEEPHAGLAKGALKFRLHGEKLRGGWALVRIKDRDSRDGTKTWLLIKEGDDEARPRARYDVTKARPESVLSGRDLAAIASEGGQEGNGHGQAAKRASRGRPQQRAQSIDPPARALSGVRKGPLPRFVEPQLATLVKEAPEGEEWLHELKFDGYRIEARLDKGAVTLLSRTAKDWTAALPTLAKALSHLPCRQALLDGEAAVLLPDGTTSFNALQNAMEANGQGRIVYFAFDLLHLDGRVLKDAPLEERKAELRRLLDKAGRSADLVRYSDHVTGSGADFLAHACRMKLEGIVSKRRNDAYREGRGRSWVKSKCTHEQEMVIGGFTEPKGRRTGIGALLLGVNEGGELRYSGKVGTGFTERSSLDLRRRLDTLLVAETPFAKRPAGVASAAHWVKPRLVAQVEFSEWTPDGHLRHPSFKGLRADKAAAEVVREEPEAARQEEQAPKPHAPTRTHEAATVRGVRMTHPDRVLFPESRLTKLKLAEWYVGIAPWILPHLKGRPTSLVRCPEGVAEPCFYQKHGAAFAPRELRRVRIQEKKKAADYLVVEDEAGLVALVQMSILEIHTWNSHFETLERPDRIVFDLDPAEGLPWKRVVGGALLLRQELIGLGLKSFVKTTGGKGLHVVVPLAGGASWDAGLAFSRNLAERVAAERPREYLAEMSKARRVGRIYIDYLRNQRGATSVCAYSTRAKPEAPVSAPLHWDELDEVKPPQITVANLEKRLRALRQDPWKGYDELKQVLPS
jgi:bifunctional non-homologous end joining protein LigD